MNRFFSVIVVMLLQVTLIHAQTKYSITESKDKLGLIDDKNNILIPSKYNYIGKVKNALVLVGKGKFDLDENYLLVDVLKNSKFGVYSLTLSKEIIPCKYDWISIENEGSIIVYKGSFDTENGLEQFFPSSKGFGLFDSQGLKVVDCQYDYIDNSAEGAIILADLNFPKNMMRQHTYYKNDEFYVDAFLDYPYNDSLRFPIYKLVDNMGAQIMLNEYHCIGTFSGNLALVYKGVYESFYQDTKGDVSFLNYSGKFGYINTMGQEVIPLIYDKAQTFKDGKALVEKDGQEFYIDINGNEIE